MRTAQMPEVIFGSRMYVSVEASRLDFSRRCVSVQFRTAERCRRMTASLAAAQTSHGCERKADWSRPHSTEPSELELAGAPPINYELLGPAVRADLLLGPTFVPGDVFPHHEGDSHACGTGGSSGRIGNCVRNTRYVFLVLA
jgi:hypothetical protein